MIMPDNRNSRVGGHPAYARVGLALLLVVVVIAVFAGILRSRGYSLNDFLPETVPLQVEPYVQNMTQTSVSILWDTAVRSESTVSYGTSPALGRTASDQPGTRHDVHLSGLRSDTRYYYRVQDDGPVSDIHAFRTAPGVQATLTFAVVGDSGSGSKDQYQMAAVVAKISPQLVVHVGDVVYKAGAERQYGPHFYRPYKALLSSVPFYPSLGNHDVRTNDGAPYLQAFDLPENDPQHTERYYSFDYGAVHFVALDSELYYADHSLSVQAQKAWLEKDLDQSRRHWRIVFFHRPPFSSSLGPHPGGDERIRADLVPVFERAHVDVVLNGHQHNYERFRPINGVTYIVTGGGGGERLYPITPGQRSAYAASRLNVLKAIASPGTLEVEAVGADGAVFDRVRLTKK